MADVPETGYARTPEGVSLAYQVLGDGPIDLVVVPQASMPIDLLWEEPAIVEFLRRLASFSRLVLTDLRGFGSSGSVNMNAVPALQIWTDDLGAVMEAVGWEKAAFLSWGEAALPTMLFAATHPGRVTSLALVNSYARYLRDAECPWGLPPNLLSKLLATTRDVWGTGTIATALAPSLAQNRTARRRLARAERLSGSPEDVAAISNAFFESDLTHVLPSIQAPTLVISRRGEGHVRFQHGRYLADRVPRAKLVELLGDDQMPYSGRAEEIVEEIEEFLTGVRPIAVLDRMLATVMFTDIVGSTEHAAKEGDRRWRESLDRYDDLVQRHLQRFRGRYVNTTGDGSVATFDGPARAIECARTISDESQHLGFQLRAGLHTGEVESRGEDVAGVAVHIAARVANLAGAGEVLVSRTVVDLVAGSGIQFEDRGEQELKGVPGTWRLYAVTG